MKVTPFFISFISSFNSEINDSFNKSVHYGNPMDMKISQRLLLFLCWLFEEEFTFSLTLIKVRVRENPIGLISSLDFNV